VFRNEGMKLVAINAARFDASKHRAISVVGDALVTLHAIDADLGDYKAPPEWLTRTGEVRRAWYSYLDEISAPDGKPTYAKVIRAVNEVCDASDYQVSAAGGLPGELNAGWHSKSVHSFDAEYGYSTMGYEIAGAWGAKMALPDRDVICWTGDGSYLMMNSDIYSTVMTGHKVIFIVCDNAGFAVINRLQVNTGGEEFNNLLRSSRHQQLSRVDFVKHAEAMGAVANKVESIAALKEAFAVAKTSDRSSVIVIEVDEYSWTGGGAWWEVGVPEVSDREQVRVARAELEAERKHQRVGT
jgi:3D-(3,5/4)-trihydroxycyclohexane-1,2-dione acylhydrolase (decyclizing)